MPTPAEQRPFTIVHCPHPTLEQLLDLEHSGGTAPPPMPQSHAVAVLGPYRDRDGIRGYFVVALLSSRLGCCRLDPQHPAYRFNLSQHKSTARALRRARHEARRRSLPNLGWLPR